MTFDDYINARDYAANTRAAYLSNLGQFKAWFETTNREQLQPALLTAGDVKIYREQMIARGAAPNTINQHLAAIRAFGSWAVESGQLQSNPASRVRGVKQQQTAPKWLTRTEQAALIREAERACNAAHTEARQWLTARNRIIIIVLLNTGLRVGELCNLDLGDVEISPRKGTLRVRDGKGQKSRMVPMNKTAREVVFEWLKEYRAEKTGKAWTLFVNRTGQAMDSKDVQVAIGDIARRAGVKCTPHTLRHTLAKNLVDAGVRETEIADILGHEKLDTTRLYTRPAEADLERAVERID